MSERWRPVRLSARPASIVAALLVPLLLVAGCSAGSSAGGEGDSEEDLPLVLTTFTVLADIAENVAGEHLQVESITRVGAEIHGYEPTPSDIRTAAGADLVLDNGLGLEAWFEQFIAEVDVPRVVVSEGVETIDIAGDVDAGLPNPHAWMSPLNVQIYVANMVEAFSALDPENAEAFEANGQVYGQELQDVHEDLLSALADVPTDQRALLTCEGAFSYLARDAQMSEFYLWPVNAESEATPQRIAAAIEVVNDRDIPAVFCESTVSDAPMQQVVEATDTEFGGVLYVDSLSEPDGPVPTYLELIRHDANLIADALAGA